jgi:high affinity Mn2+ porin
LPCRISPEKQWFFSKHPVAKELRPLAHFHSGRGCLPVSLDHNNMTVVNFNPMKKVLLITTLAIASVPLSAQETDPNEDLKKPARSSFHYQMTSVTQWVGDFKSNYVSDQSFLSLEKRTTLSATFFAGYRLAKNTELYVNPEMAGGGGLSGVFGIASFPNAEAMRTGKQAPFYYVARLFVKHTFALGQEKDWQEDGVNTLAGYVPRKRIVLTVGKMALTDYFDANSFSHDGRTQFFNWSVGTQGAYDFAADNKAYTQGAVLEYVNLTGWKFRYSFAQLSSRANGPTFNWNMGVANHQVVEIEKPFSVVPGKQGILRVLAYQGLNKYGRFANAIDENGVAIPLDQLHTVVGKKYGVGVNLEQSLSENIGFFARSSWNNGVYETWSYTEIDQSITGGFVFSGKLWKREDDKFGIAGGMNGISTAHRNYLKAGGTGILLGDGTLNYGSEQVFETYYSLRFNKNIWATVDYQFCINPGYNKDRGPVWNMVGLRVHAEL